MASLQLVHFITLVARVFLAPKLAISEAMVELLVRQGPIIRQSLLWALVACMTDRLPIMGIPCLVDLHLMAPLCTLNGA